MATRKPPKKAAKPHARPGGAKTAGTLSPQQERFIREYLLDRNATQAAVRAGYSPKTAHVQGPRLLQNVAIATAVKQAEAKVLGKIEVKAERIQQERERLGLYDIGALAMLDDCASPRDIAALPDEIRQAVKGWKWDKQGRFCLETYDKNPHLAALERIHGMYQQAEPGDGAHEIHIHLG